MPGDHPRIDLPDQDDAPLVWDARSRSFAPLAEPAVAPSRPASRPKKQWHVGSDAVGRALPPRDGGQGTAPAQAPTAPRTVAAPVPTSPAPRPTPRQPRPDPRPQARSAPPPQPKPAEAPAPPKGPRRRRRRLLRRPKLRWIALFLALVPLLLVALLVGGWFYANSMWNRIERVEVSSALSPASGDGTNYLIVGSDSRDAVVEQGGTDPNVQPNAEAPSGQRSDTMLILRTTPEGAVTMSIPRDLFVTLPDGDEGRINGAFNDGPAALVDTIESNLDIPIHRYVEVDFVTFGSLVDALGGVTLTEEMVPCPAFDPASGLNLTEAGPVTVDGQTALAWVRSRHYTEVCDGVERTDPTGDLGRIQRQQAFLRTVLADAGASRNPLTLMRIGSSLTEGLRIDDEMTMLEAMRFAWDMGTLDPVPVELPTFPFRTSGGAAVLGMDEELAPAALDQFR